MANKRLSTLLMAHGLPHGAGNKMGDLPGAGAGLAMSSYNLFGWTNWASSDYFFESFYNDLATLTFTFDMASNANFYRIRYGIPYIEVYDNTGSSGLPVEVIGGAWNSASNGATGNSIQVRLHARAIYGSATPSVVFNWYQGYAQGDPYPDNSVAWWEIDLSVPTGDAIGVYETLNLMFHYPVDAGGFNDGYLYGPTPVKVNSYGVKRTMDYEWYTGYNANPNLLTGLVNTGPYYVFRSHADLQYQGTFYVRYRETGTSTWNGPLTVNWHDPRWS